MENEVAIDENQPVEPLYREVVESLNPLKGDYFRSENRSPELPFWNVLIDLRKNDIGDYKLLEHDLGDDDRFVREGEQARELLLLLERKVVTVQTVIGKINLINETRNNPLEPNALKETIGNLQTILDQEPTPADFNRRPPDQMSQITNLVICIRETLASEAYSGKLDNIIDSVSRTEEERKQLEQLKRLPSRQKAGKLVEFLKNNSRLSSLKENLN